MAADLAIQSIALRKEFGSTIAVRGLDLEVARGEVFGFLGPNGAGKTTSIKMFLNLVQPTSGKVEILGMEASSKAARARVGFLPEHFRFHDWLSAQEFLQLHGHLYGLRSPDLDIRIDELLHLVNLEEFREKQLRTFSKGMLQRIGLAQALLNKPDLVFLDEPTSGLDPVGRRMVRDIIRTLRHQGTCVFLNSHLLSEVEITCDRVAFIKYGEVLRISELAELVNGETTLTIRVKNLVAEKTNRLSEWGKDIRLDGDTLHMVISDETVLPMIHRYLVGIEAQVFAVIPEKISLEDLFIQIVGTDGGL
jgi:ABC-2 type transport system ATP-binding protein